MPTRYESEQDLEDTGGDREISLGTGTVLAIFLALALVCSLFFGLGYSMGRKSASPLSSAASAASAPALSPSGGDKPSPASRLRPGSSSSVGSPDTDGQVPQPAEPSGADTQTSTQFQNQTDSSATSPRRQAAAADRNRPSATRPVVAPMDLPAPAQQTENPAAIPGATPVYVQVAAVSRREDADLLLGALTRRGYTGIVRPQTQDRLLHIQVGPFATKKDAEAMRQRLIVDGYNPILK